MALLEIIERQPHQMMKQAAAHREMQRILQAKADQRRSALAATLIASDNSEAQRKNDQKIDIAAGNHLVDRDLQIERRRDQADFNDDGQRENLAESMDRAAHPAEKRGERDLCPFVLFREIFERPGFDGDPGYMFRGFVIRQPAFALCRIVNDDPLARRLLKDDEMVHVPMQDGGQAQLRKMVQLDAQRTAGEFQMARDFDQRAERHPLQ